MKIMNRTLRISIPRGSNDCAIAVIRDEENRAVAYVTTTSGSLLVTIADQSDCTVGDESEKNAVCNPKTDNRTPTQKRCNLMQRVRERDLQHARVLEQRRARKLKSEN